MIYLSLAILSSFTIGILIKINELNRANAQVVLASNYIIASVIGWIFFFIHGNYTLSTSTLILGIIGGILWPSTFFMMMWGVRNFGLSIIGSMIRLSLIVPVLFALIFLNEYLSLNVSLGIIATFTAFYFLRKPGSKQTINKHTVWFFPLVILCFGLVDLWVNVFNHYGVEREKFLFMILIFSFSGIFSFVAVFIRKVKIDKKSFNKGLLLGIPNFFSTYFLMESLKTSTFIDNSAVVYSLYSVMGVTLAFGAGVLIWKEKINGFNFIGFIAAVIAIILLNFR